MRLLPHETLTIRTQEPLLKVIEKLEAQIEAPRIFGWSFSRNHRPYVGTISNSGFKIHRIIHYRNSFLPVIRGEFESLSDGTIVHISMSLDPVVLAFLSFWLFLWYGVSIPILISDILSGNLPEFQALLFLGLPIFLLFILICGFGYEANRSRRELTQIIGGKAL